MDPLDLLLDEAMKDNATEPLDKASKIVKEVEEQFRNGFTTPEEKDRQREETELKEELKKLKNEFKKHPNVKNRRAAAVIRGKDGKVTLASKNVNEIKRETRKNIKLLIAEIELRLSEIEMEKKSVKNEQTKPTDALTPAVKPNYMSIL